MTLKMVEIDEKQAFSVISKAKDTGNVKIGANEVTKAVERGQAQLVITGTDVSPAEIVAHFPGLCKEMNILFLNSGTKEELGSLVGIKSTTALGVVDAGSAKKELDALVKESKEESAKEVAKEKEAEKKEAEEKKEVAEEKKEASQEESEETSEEENK